MRRVFLALGVEHDKLRVTGSVKYDGAAAAGMSDDADGRRLAGFEGMLERALGTEGKVVMAVSSFAGEELLLARVVEQLGSSGRRIRLVLVPRHAERGGAVAAELERAGWQVWRRSLVDAWSERRGRAAGDGKADEGGAVAGAAAAAKRALVVDSTGELRLWLELAQVAVMGKSWCGVGGQNPVEPMVAGAAVLCGPRMDNFRHLVTDLVQLGAFEQVVEREPEAMERCLRERLLALLERSEGESAAAREAGMVLMTEHDGAAQRTVAGLRSLL